MTTPDDDERTVAWAGPGSEEDNDGDDAPVDWPARDGEDRT